MDATRANTALVPDGCDVKIRPTHRDRRFDQLLSRQSKNVTAELRLQLLVASGVGGTLYETMRPKQVLLASVSVRSGAVRNRCLRPVPPKYNGSGYHDHSWGNVSITPTSCIIGARGGAQVFMIISAWLTAEAVQFAETPVFMLTPRTGKRMRAAGRGLRFLLTDQHQANTGKPFSDSSIHWGSRFTLLPQHSSAGTDIAYLKMVGQLPETALTGCQKTLPLRPLLYHFTGTASIDDRRWRHRAASRPHLGARTWGRCIPGVLSIGHGTGGDPRQYLSRRRLSPRTRCHAPFRKQASRRKEVVMLSFASNIPTSS